MLHADCSSSLVAHDEMGELTLPFCVERWVEAYHSVSRCCASCRNVLAASHSLCQRPPGMSCGIVNNPEAMREITCCNISCKLPNNCSACISITAAKELLQSLQENQLASSTGTSLTSHLHQARTSRSSLYTACQREIANVRGRAVQTVVGP